MTSSQQIPLNTVRFCGYLLLHSLIAILGTPALVGIAGHAFHPRTPELFLAKIWILDTVCAAFLGFLIGSRWKRSAALWVWVLPGLWFTAVFLLALASSRAHSIFSSETVTGRFFGSDCVQGSRVGCQYFWVFTIPLVRGVCYSLAAWGSPAHVAQLCWETLTFAGFRLREKGEEDQS